MAEDNKLEEEDVDEFIRRLKSYAGANIPKSAIYR